MRVYDSLSTGILLPDEIEQLGKCYGKPFTNDQRMHKALEVFVTVVGWKHRTSKAPTLLVKHSAVQPNNACVRNAIKANKFAHSCIQPFVQSHVDVM